MLEDVKKDAVERMQKCVVAFRNELKRLRTGRAHPSLLEHIRVEYYGNEVFHHQKRVENGELH